MPAPVRESVEAHVGGILDRAIPANRWVRLAAERWEMDMHRAGLEMRWELVTQMVEWIEGLRLVGNNAGELWTLLPWQRWFLAGCVGWHRGDGYPRTRFGLLQIARKNGKSTLMAGLCLWHLIGQQKPGRSVHVIANKIEQAKIVMDTSREMAGPLLPFRDQKKRKSIRHNAIYTDWGDMTVLAAEEKSLDGLDPSLWVGDEAAEWRGRFIAKMLTANIGRTDGLGVIISTPGNSPDLDYPQRVKVCEKVLLGELELDEWFPLIYGIDEEDHPEDQECWPKANPSLGASLQLSTLQRQWEAMKLSPMERIEFQRFHLARATDVVGRWLDMRQWDAITEPADVPDGAEVWLGVDLSKSLDMSAIMVLRPDAAGVVHLQGHYWYPAANAAEREIQHQMPFRKWAEEGRLTLSPGAVIDYESMVQAVIALAARYRVVRIAVDPWNSQMFNEMLGKHFGDGRGNRPVVLEHPQGIGTMAPASQTWQELWVAGKFRHSQDPILRAACANTAVIVDDAGNIRPSKGRSRGIIDPLVAAVMAAHAWSLDCATTGSMYEQGVGVG